MTEDYRKLNGVLRYSQGTREDGFSLTGMAYRGRWTSTDQLASRVIDSGQVDRYGTLDDSTGGETFRYSLSGEWARRGDNSQITGSAWWLRSGLDLWSNFQYCLNDYAASGSCATGDQFKQGERRQAGGFSAAHTIFERWSGFEVANSFGVDGRVDRINPVGLYNTQRRVVWNTVREDAVTQRSLSVWAQNETRWSDWFRSQVGVRGDTYDFTVDAGLPANSGTAGDQMLTPKLALSSVRGSAASSISTTARVSIPTMRAGRRSASSRAIAGRWSRPFRRWYAPPVTRPACAANRCPAGRRPWPCGN